LQDLFKILITADRNKTAVFSRENSDATVVKFVNLIGLCA